MVLQYRTAGEKAEALAAELSTVEGQQHRTLATDLTDPASVEQLVEEAIGGDRLHLVVNNAGIFERHPPLTVDYEAWQHHWQKTLGVNLVGPANVSWCAGRHMVKAGGGRIINITSRGAFRGEPESPAYGASKAGLNSLSQSLALALAPHGIFVFAIAPGFVETAMVRDYITGELAESIRRQSPLHRVARPEDVAYWVGCLAEDEASFATGTIIDVNGASYLRS